MDYLKTILDALLPLVVTLLSALLAYGTAYLRKKMSALESEVSRTLLQSALEEIDKVAMDAVLATQQVLTDDLKAKSEDGKLTKEEATQCFNYAINYFYNHISEDAMKILSKTITETQVYVQQLIEAKLGEIKLYK